MKNSRRERIFQNHSKERFWKIRSHFNEDYKKKNPKIKFHFQDYGVNLRLCRHFRGVFLNICFIYHSNLPKSLNRQLNPLLNAQFSWIFSLEIEIYSTPISVDNLLHLLTNLNYIRNLTGIFWIFPGVQFASSSKNWTTHIFPRNPSLIHVIKQIQIIISSPGKRAAAGTTTEKDEEVPKLGTYAIPSGHLMPNGTPRQVDDNPFNSLIASSTSVESSHHSDIDSSISISEPELEFLNSFRGVEFHISQE